MTDTQEASEQLRAANPLPADHVDADELGRFLSYFEERRDAMRGIQTIHRDESAKKAPRRLRPGLVFATSLVAVLAVFGVTALLLQGEDGLVDPAAPIADSSVEPTSPVTALPAIPSAGMVITALSDSPEYFATVQAGPDGLPIVASQQFDQGDELGTVRLFFCADAACEQTRIVEVMEAQWLGRELEFTVAPNGNLYLIVGAQPDGETVMLYRDSELQEVTLPFNWPPGEGHATAILPSAFMEDGRPVFVGLVGDHKSLVVCDDPTCETSTEIELEKTGTFDEKTWAFVDGDDVKVVYAVSVLTGQPDPEAGYDGATMMWTTKISTIAGLDGTPTVTTETVNEGLNEFPIESAMTDDGSLVMWLFSWQEQGIPGEPLVSYSTLTCSGSACTKAEAPALGQLGWPYRTTPDARMISVFAEDVYDPADYEAYLEEERRISEQGLDEGADMPDALGTNLVVAECVDTACTAAMRHTIEARQGWWYLDSLGIAIGEDGTTFVLVGSSGEVGSPGLTLYRFPAGTLADRTEPISGTAVIR